jgi:hypothetical protein
VARPLNRLGKFALVFCASARLAAWADLAIVGNKAAQYFDLLVVNRGGFLCAELALTRAYKEPALPTLLIV